MKSKKIRVGIGLDNPKTARCAKCNHLLKRHKFHAFSNNLSPIKAECITCNCKGNLSIA